MAGIGNNDYIQQQLLDQSVAMNDNLSAMRTVLLDIKKNTNKGSGSGGSGGGNNDSGNGGGPSGGGSGGSGGAFKNAFKDLFGEAQNIGRTMLGNSGSIQNTVGSFTSGAKVLQNSLGKLPGPIGMAATAFLQIVQVGGMVYEYMNEQLNMYNELNSAGLTLSDGMLTVRKGAAGAFMSINDFSGAIKRNSQELAAMEGQYGDGVEHFGKLINTVQLAQDKMGLYGVSQQQLADITAKNYKFEKMYAGEQSLRSMSESQSTEKFVGTMTYLSKTVGKSVDELLKSFDSMSDTVDSEVTEQALKQRFGFSDDKAAQVNKTFNSVYASMGKSGETLQKLMSSKNFQNMLPDEYNNNFTQLYTNQLQQLQAAGVTDEKQARRAMSQWVKEHQDMLDMEIGNQTLMNNTAAAAWLKQLKTQEALLNDPKNNPTPLFENMTQRFNNWIGKTFTEPFNTFYAKTAEDASKYLTDLADNSTDAWDFMSKLATDAFTKFNSGMLGPFGALTEIPGKIMSMIFGDSWKGVSDAFLNLGGDLVQVPIRIGKLIWEMFTGSEGDIDQAGKEMMGSIKKIFSDVIGVFTNIGNLSINFDDVKTKFLDAFNSLKNKLSSMWDRVKGWWNDSEEPEEAKPEPPKPAPAAPPTASQPTNVGNQTVTAKTEITKPVKVEQADQSSPITEQQTASNGQEDMNKVLNEILNSIQSQNSNANQTALILRQIAENTEPPRNV
ncbi:hypothetical protein XbC2_247 [Xanthomonas phage XbC2]|nr:hypothetical protein XbC2_247 [Xanthomonas phage XbC2]